MLLNLPVQVAVWWHNVDAVVAIFNTTIYTQEQFRCLLKFCGIPFQTDPAGTKISFYVGILLNNMIVIPDDHWCRCHNHIKQAGLLRMSLAENPLKGIYQKKLCQMVKLLPCSIH